MNEISSYKDSLEKQHIRSNCWVPLLKSRKGARERLKYLTLPGKMLTEIRLFAEERIILGMNDLTLCESRRLEYYQICRDLPEISFFRPAEIPTVGFGNIEDLVLGNHLESRFPFDAINLDFEGGAWGSSESSLKMDTIRHLIEKQGESRRSFTLFLTLSTRSGGTSVLDEVLTPYHEDFSEYAASIEKMRPHQKHLYVLPIILIHWGFKMRFDVSIVRRYTYIGLETRVLMFAFEFDVIQDSDWNSSVTPLAHKERQRVREALNETPIELVLDAESSQVIEKAYNPD